MTGGRNVSRSGRFKRRRIGDVDGDGTQSQGHGIDPGLQCTGFGVVQKDGSQLQYVASGTIRTTSGIALGDLPGRLKMTAPAYTGLQADAIPVVPLPGDAGSVALVSGRFVDAEGPIRSRHGLRLLEDVIWTNSSDARELLGEKRVHLRFRSIRGA